MKGMVNFCSLIALLGSVIFLWSLKHGMTNKESIILSPQQVFCMLIAVLFCIASVLVLLVNGIRAMLNWSRRIRK